MNIIWGIILTITSLIGYLGQVMTTFWPERATQMGLTESETDVDPAFYADVRGEAIWDSAVLWILPVAGILLILNNPFWPYLGLVGGGMFLYFAGRGIVTRRVMQRRGIRVGIPETLKVGTIALVLWGLVAFITIILAVAALPLT